MQAPGHRGSSLRYRTQDIEQDKGEVSRIQGQCPGYRGSVQDTGVGFSIEVQGPGFRCKVQNTGVVSRIQGQGPGYRGRVGSKIQRYGPGYRDRVQDTGVGSRIQGQQEYYLGYRTSVQYTEVVSMIQKSVHDTGVGSRIQEQYLGKSGRVMNTGIGVLITGTDPGEMSRITWNDKIELHFLFYVHI